MIAEESPSMLDLSRSRLIDWVSQDLHLPMHALTRLIDSLGGEVAQETRTQLRTEVERLRSTVCDLIAITQVDKLNAHGRLDEVTEAPLSLAG